MKYTSEQIQEMIKQYRESLKPDWTRLHTEQTPRGKGQEKPSVIKQYPNKEVVELDSEVSGLGNGSLHDIVMSRRSIRKYADDPMSLKELSYLCKLTCHIRKIGDGFALGVIPTGGARNTLETYIYANNVKGLKPGMYHYMKDTGNLSLIDEKLEKELVDDSLLGQLRGANVVFYFTATPYRSEYKYSFTAHKMIAMEAGHACQNLYLASESIGYGMVAIAAYDQTKSDALLKLDANEEFVVYAATVGKKVVE